MQKWCKYMQCFKFIATVSFFFIFSQVTVAQSAKVRVETVREGSFRDHTEALGTLRGNETVELTVNVTESITAIHFDDGQEVKASELLVEMTSSEESALLVEAQTTAFEARRQLDRIQLLVNSGTASESLLDLRTREYEAAQARLIATQSRLKDRIVTAPFSGVVGLRNVSLGALVRPGDIITTLTDNSRMKLDFTVPSVFLPLLKKDLPLVATTRAYLNEQFHGKVIGINNQIDPITRAITVRAIIPNDTDKLKPGMLMRVDLSMNERSALVISEESLIPEGNTTYVFVVNDSEGKSIAEKRKVTIANRRVGEVEIVEGLQAGERVITHGGFKVKSGMSVEIHEGLPNGAKSNQSLRAAVK